MKKFSTFFFIFTLTCFIALTTSFYAFAQVIYPMNVTPQASPGVAGIGDPVSLTIHDSNNFLDQTGEGLFDGDVVNEWDTNRVYYWYNNYENQFLELEFDRTVNIWRSGTSWEGHCHYLKILKYDNGNYTDVTGIYTRPTRAIYADDWDLSIEELPAGRYKFFMDSDMGARLDSEWYVCEPSPTRQEAKTAVEEAEDTLDQLKYDIALDKVTNLVDAIPVTISTTSTSGATEETFTIDGTWHTVNATVLQNANKVFLNDYINPLIQSGVKKFYIENGNYNLSYQITVNLPDVKIVGQSKDNTILKQTDQYSDGIVITANSATISTLTVDCVENTSQTPVIQSNSSNVTLQNCIFNSDEHCTIEFFGNTSVSINDIETGALDENNIILNCTINANNCISEAILFTKQRMGVCKGNIINGARLGFYLCRASYVQENVLNNSTTHGILCSVPSFYNVIANNTINAANYSAIKVGKDFINGANDNHRSRLLKIFGNTINQSYYMGIELTQAEYSHIYDNEINDTDLIGIYVLRVEKSILKNNDIFNPTHAAHNDTLTGWAKNRIGGIYADFHVINTIFDNNIVENSLTYDSTEYEVHGIKIENSSENNLNKVQANIIKGIFSKRISPNVNGTYVLEKEDLLERLNDIQPQ